MDNEQFLGLVRAKTRNVVINRRSAASAGYIKVTDLQSILTDNHIQVIDTREMVVPDSFLWAVFDKLEEIRFQVEVNENKHMALAKIASFQSLCKGMLSTADTPEKPQEAKCEHGKGLTDYCQPCGRIHGQL